MGEAIARFRELALASRCRSDAAFIQPSHILLSWLPPWKTLAIERRLLAGKMQPREFASLLRLAARHASSRRGEPDFSLSQKDRRDLSLSVGGAVREATLANSPAVRDLARQQAAALSEASVCEDRLLASVEKRLAALSEATLAMREMAADFWLARYSQTKAEYAKQLVRWQRAYDALAVYVDELPKAAGSSPRREQPRTGKRVGRPHNDEALARELLDGWRAYEPEDGRPTKADYLAQRPDVRKLKSEEARLRKIASLRVALDSALHLRREKTRRKKRARG